MDNKFNYQDECWYEDNFGNIQNALFSEYWEYGVSYIKKGNESITIETKKLFDTKKNLLLFIFEEKKKSIEAYTRLIEKFNRKIPLLYEELIMLQNKIEKEK